MSRVRSRRGTRSWTALDVWVACGVLAFTVLPLFLATAARPTDIQKLAQAVVFAGIFATAPLVLLPKPHAAYRALVIIYGTAALFAVPALTQRYFKLDWFFGDILLLTAPVLLGVGIERASRRRPELPHTVLKAFCVSLFITACIASQFPDPLDHYRFQAPAPMVMAAAWAGLVAPKSGHRLLLAVASLGILGYLTWESQWRSSAGVFLAIGLFTIAYVLRGHAKVLFVVSVGSLVILFVGFGGMDLLPGGDGAESDNRIVATFQEGGPGNDSSTTFRFVEMHAAIATAQEEWNPVNLLLGGGHGATYNFYQLAVMPESHDFEGRNSEDGRVHNIHLGFVMLGYRYGILGYALAGVLGFLTLRHAIRAARAGDFAVYVPAAGILGCIILLLANNVTTQIHYSLTVAILIPLIARAVDGTSSALAWPDKAADKVRY